MRRKKDRPFDKFEPGVYSQEAALRRAAYGIATEESWLNSRYQVDLRHGIHAEPFGRVIQLSIKRRDRLPIFDWRDVQKIKALLVGPEAEMVQVFPAESRHVDTSNQYYFFAFPNYRFPFGFTERLLSEDTRIGNTQRPFDDHHRAPDLGARDAELEAVHKLVDDGITGGAK